MNTLTAYTPDGESRCVTLDLHDTLLAALQANRFLLPAVCGGRGTCGKCKVRIISGGWEPTATDSAYFSCEELDAGWRLSCVIRPSVCRNAVITVPDEEHAIATVDDFDRENIPTPLPNTLNNKEDSPSLGIAIDIGTTTIAMCLVNLRTGTLTGRWSAVNRQREWGADVLSRIQKANEGGLLRLSQSVRGQITGGMQSLCAEAGVAPDAVEKIAVAANTTMIHLLLGLSCETLGIAPFTPVTLGPVTVPCNTLFALDSTAQITIMPGVSTYIGADIAAGVFFSGMYRNPGPSLLLDIGTNGEMALCVDGTIVTAATAAGPAFEGGNIRWGTGSVPGAISRLRYENGDWTVTTIENRPSIGICGTGLISAVWQGLRHGFIEPGGNFNSDRVPGKSLVLAQTADGRNITLEQKDIRELQLAKSAVYSGIDALLHHTGIAATTVKTLYVAGGFGHNIDYESAAGIGLIPRALRQKVRLIGNSALGGAVRYLLDRHSPAELDRIITATTEYNLSGDRRFNEAFIENVVFEISNLAL
jgi:uncharacterized 2Fe-2S/4Fe-4S cluster protein (DUF4445 family)